MKHTIALVFDHKDKINKTFSVVIDGQTIVKKMHQYNEIRKILDFLNCEIVVGRRNMKINEKLQG